MRPIPASPSLALQLPTQPLALHLIAQAKARGTVLHYAKAEAAARGYFLLKKNGFLNLTINDLQNIPPMIRRAMRWICDVILECHELDPSPWIKELERLDKCDALEIVARWRVAGATIASGNRSPEHSERAWIEANGY